MGSTSTRAHLDEQKPTPCSHHEHSNISGAAHVSREKRNSQLTSCIFLNAVLEEDFFFLQLDTVGESAGDQVWSRHRSRSSPNRIPAY